MTSNNTEQKQRGKEGMGYLGSSTIESNCASYQQSPYCLPNLLSEDSVLSPKNSRHTCIYYFYYFTVWLPMYLLLAALFSYATGIVRLSVISMKPFPYSDSHTKDKQTNSYQSHQNTFWILSEKSFNLHSQLRITYRCIMTRTPIWVDGYILCSSTRDNRILS